MHEAAAAHYQAIISNFTTLCLEININDVPTIYWVVQHNRMSVAKPYLAIASLSNCPCFLRSAPDRVAASMAFALPMSLTWTEEGAMDTKRKIAPASKRCGFLRKPPEAPHAQCRGTRPFRSRLMHAEGPARAIAATTSDERPTAHAAWRGDRPAASARSNVSGNLSASPVTTAAGAPWRRAR